VVDNDNETSSSSSSSSYDNGAINEEMNKLVKAMCAASQVASSLVNMPSNPNSKMGGFKSSSSTTSPTANLTTTNTAATATARDINMKERMKVTAEAAISAAENVYLNSNKVGAAKSLEGGGGMSEESNKSSLSQLAESFCRFILTEVRLDVVH
jgi:hypothetical protein